MSDASDYDQTVHAVRLQLVVDQNYTVADAASAMDVGLSTMTRWVKQ
ncbi:IS3 family transposase, partial [Klebsiella pneumoniae]|nr:IS3 family transposase [Klebsiella pneumoniae]